MSFSYTVAVNDPQKLGNDDQIKAAALDGLAQWSLYLSGRGSIDLTVDVGTDANGSGRGGGGAAAVVEAGRDGARTLLMSGATSELVTGNDPNFGTTDGHVSIATSYLSLLNFGGSFSTASKPVDPVWFFTHEIGHVLGMNGYYNPATGVLSSISESLWDQLIATQPGKLFFTGTLAQLVYGGPVPVTQSNAAGEAYYHLANSSTDPIIGTDLMNGIYSVYGGRVSILDVAIAADIRNPLSSYGTLLVGFAILHRTPVISSIAAADLSKIQATASMLDAGSFSTAQAMQQLVAGSASTASVATLSYEFFTGKAPTLAGMDYLISTYGSNPNNLNSSYYSKFDVVNRFINFAANLGKIGEGAASFQNSYGGLSLSDATSKAYATIFGATPAADKVNFLLHDLVPNGLGGTYEREDYFASYGKDGLSGQGTKAAMVGWLISQGVSADLGVYARSNDAYLADVAQGKSSFGIDLVGAYTKPEYSFHG